MVGTIYFADASIQHATAGQAASTLTADHVLSGDDLTAATLRQVQALPGVHAATGVTPVSAALYPLSLLFGAVVRARRAAYAHGILRSTRLPVPVVIVGNVTVGGTGKTPLVLWLSSVLRQHGRTPGIVSRGYRGSADAPVEVTLRSDAAVVGDEPLLIARRSGAPVWIGRDRTAADRKSGACR